MKIEYINPQKNIYQKMNLNLPEVDLLNSANCISQCTGCICACNRKIDEIDLEWL